MSNNRPMMDSNHANPRGASIDLQQRTLKVMNLHADVSKELLHELFSQAGPVVNVVHKPEFAFIEFEDADSVGYALALMQGVHLYGRELQMQPKLQNRPEYFQHLNTLKQYEMTVACNPIQWWQRFGSPDRLMPPHLCQGFMCQASTLPLNQPPLLPNNMPPPNYPPLHNIVPQELYTQPQNSYKHHRHSLPNEPHFNRNHQNGANARFVERYSPYRRQMDSRYGNRGGYSQPFYERDWRDTDWRHRRSN